jgi:hypothetical protein
MNELDRFIQAAREEFEPTPADRARNRRRLGASVAGAAAAGSLVAKSAAATGTASVLAGHTFGGLAKLFFASMACTLVGASAVVGVTRAVSKPPAEVTKVTLVSAKVTGREPAPPLSPTPELPAVPAPPTPGEPGAGGHPRTVDLPARASGANVAAAAPSSANLDAELASLRLARDAAAAGDHQRAEELLDGLDRQYPRGLLLEERSALRAVARCQSGDAPRARALAREFLLRYPTSVYAAKVRRACHLVPELAPLPGSGATASFTELPDPGH